MEENEPKSPTASSPDPVPEEPVVADPVARFRGLGTNFRAKLIGVDDVPDSRGDQMCQESIIKLKASVLASGRHKQKIIVNVSLEGIKIVDVLSGEVQHVHPVHRISFIARDTTDRRAFGYVYGAGEGRHQFYGIKTAKAAEGLVLALRDLFQVVYDMKKKEMDEAKATQKESDESPSQPGNEEPSAVTPQVPPNNDNILDLKQQLTSIQEGINTMDAIGPWSGDGNNVPESSSEQNQDLFGLAETTTQAPQQNSFSDELFNLEAPVAQPPPQPGAKLTNDQILSGFGGQQQQQQQQQFYGMPGAVPQGMPFQAAQVPGHAGYPAAAYAQLGAFPSGPSPAIPPRPGAMRPATNSTLPQGSNQNPFGDSFAGQAPMLAPVASTASNNGLGKQEPTGRPDPFANLIPGMSSTSSTSTDKKDMFKNFQMSKPPQPPPRTNPPAPKAAEPAAEVPKPQSSFENYLFSSVGGVPVNDEANAPANGMDPFGDLMGATNTSTSQPLDFMQNGDNSTSLFG